MAVLITGGAGFLGRFVAKHFDSPVILDLKEGKGGIFEFGSVTAWSDIAEVFRKHEIEGVIHAAAELSVKAEKSHVDAFRANVEGALNILEACRVFDVEKVVFTSSHSVYGPRSYPFTEFSYRDPTTFYGATKACSEILGTYYSYTYGIDFRAVRFPILVGPFRRGMGASVAFSSLIDDAFFNGTSVITLPEETKLPVLYVKDAAELVFRLYSIDRVSKPIFNVGGVVLSIKDIVEAVKKFIPFKPQFRIDDESRRIAQQWTLMTEMVEKAGIIDKYSRIEELDWEIRWKSAEEIVEDHLKTLAEVEE
ncbi:NAD-dependent epimerase/dehydratase family protein [Archaeoglobus fulgidus]|uniref:UDP-glucose 4-epimerase (GalE-2) n=1 Tax=Archaeoglobus fulgidus (strain ATCC 49558 / DSM 4304 / JCM 9628 / NBRC 100126 / VC-16) TaxID=224325 RepID=O28263_ARCFU|nr:NAD-dependent epimerase/dehydratase family protein [Archaeoglobus fulgidus]AAB89234.1 UDP-glucose 4-epimerase (galE-2) [Archaeoglobus fulgidus DSM 4304]